uniref:Tail terminator n=1 Tax=Mycobacterium phage BabyBack TaxID=3158877 RepID=A0AAU8GR15_9CAUD
MALTRIAALFPEVVTSPVQTIGDEPGWLFAQTCETWWKGAEDVDPVTILLVYRSPLVTDTSRLYGPIADMHLSFNRCEIIGSGERFDPHMMGERGQFMVARMTHADRFQPGPLDMDQAREIICRAASAVLPQVLAAV